ncbi:putative non-specific serine/threonine protein kinase [Rosa chinensis]|uniref:Putative non-specific serine/threonine protein kinase n=1 Tax=Rosa chinensis TaxID=74649 RepID=A0A2P6S7L4_ROSCH|nr:putative non-specific serine/threonine protein kinase [Rosa chinensis]
MVNLSKSLNTTTSWDFLPIICQIESLQILDVSHNLLTTIPFEFIIACGSIDGLKLLNFSYNNLTDSLPSFVGFAVLEFLDLSHNSLFGSFSLELDGSVGLKSLNLSFNHFGGSVPTHLGKCMVLEELVLSKNGFHGVMPVEILGYQNLTLIGSISQRMGELSKLEVGKILSNITSLKRFAAHTNYFRGPCNYRMEQN